MLLNSLFSCVALAATAQAVKVTVESSGGNATSPYQYGIMFEDINNSGDGGVYAELVQNRAFQGNTIFPSNLDFWYSIGGAKLALKNLTDPLSSALPTSMQVTGGSGDIGFWNEGAYNWARVGVLELELTCALKASGAFQSSHPGIIMAPFT